METLETNIFQQAVQSSPTCTSSKIFESMTICSKFVLVRQSFLLQLTFVRSTARTPNCIASFKLNFTERSRIKPNGNRRLKRCAKLSSKIFFCLVQEQGLMAQPHHCNTNLYLHPNIGQQKVINSNVYHFRTIFMCIILE